MAAAARTTAKKQREQAFSPFEEMVAKDQPRGGSV
jgi:hypothetical protein